jgi:tetratricopeptide (TPR) repeat protein
VDEFISNAKEKDNTLQLVIGLGLKSTVLYHLNLYKKAEKILLEQNQLANKLGYTNYEADSLIDILNLYTAGMKKDYSVISEYYNRLKKLSNKLKKPSYMYNADASMGMYYLNNDKYKLANKYFINALQYIKGKMRIDYFSSFYANILFYIGYINYKEMRYNRSVRFFNKSRLVCKDKNMDEFLAYVENALGRSFFFNKSYKRAVQYFNRSIKKAMIFKIDFILGDSYMYLGRIYKERSMNTKALKNFTCSLNAYNRLKSKREDIDIVNSIREIKSFIKEINH